MIFADQSSSLLKLAFVPDWSQHNPYQKLLYEEITASGIACHGMKGADFTLAWILKNRKDFKYIHLHWLQGLFHSEIKGLCWSCIITLVIKILLSRLVGYKVLWTVHNIVSHETSNYKLETITRKIIARAVNKVIVHCAYARGVIIKLWGINSEKVTVIPHGSYIGYYANDVSRSHARQVLNIEDDQFTFLFFGMLRNYKGVKNLLSSYNELKKTKHDIRLIIAGNPHSEIIKGEIEDMAAGAGISLYLSFISDNDVQLFFKASDVVVLPYLNILTSGAAVLALSFGRPIIAPAKGCIPELLNETIAFLYHNQDDLTDSMANAATKTDMAKMSEKAIEKAEELKWEKLVANYYLPLLKRE